MFSTSTVWLGLRKTPWWNAGTKGAPWPPAATSRLRKSATTRMPVSSANKAGFAVAVCSPCRRTPGGDGGRFVHGRPGH